MFYQKKSDVLAGDEVKAGDQGSVIMLSAFAGKMKYFPERDDGAAPAAGYHSHGSPNHLEIFIFNPAQVGIQYACAYITHLLCVGCSKVRGELAIIGKPSS